MFHANATPPRANDIPVFTVIKCRPEFQEGLKVPCRHLDFGAQLPDINNYLNSLQLAARKNRSP
jgi:hypothetical protein